MNESTLNTPASSDVSRTGFLASVWAECLKVQWPTRAALLRATLTVLVVCAAMACFLAACDGVFGRLPLT